MARKYNDWIVAYLKYTENTEPRDSYKLWTAISTIASVLQRKVYLNWGSETWFPNFYIVLTGPPAARKGTAMKPARQLLNRLGIKIAADESSREKLIDTLKQSTVRTDLPNGKIRMDSPLTIQATELTVFLKSGDTSMLSTLCKWFDCEGRYQYDTLSRGMADIPNVWVNLIGATTPRLLQSTLPVDAFGSGFISRTLFVYEDNKARSIIYPSLVTDMEDELLLDLERIGLMKGQFKIAQSEPDIIQEYGKWYIETDANPVITDPRLLDCNQRQQMHMWKICMVLSASRSNDFIITLEDFYKAKDMITRLLERMPRAFAGIGTNPLAGVQAQIMTLLERKKAVHVVELTKMFYNDVSMDQLSEILATLAQAQFLIYDKKNCIVKYNC